MTRPSGDIAIVAAACRFPDARSPEELWEAVVDGRCSVPTSRPARWDGAAPARARAALLDDVAGFDAALFGMSDEEAAFTDPQQRVLLEVAHEALERAGLAGPRRAGRAVGVFVGAGQADYQEGLLRRLWTGADVPGVAAVGNLRNLMAARVSHCLDLRGPAVVVDTACSSSLVAIHQARESLLRGECDLALGCGVTLNLTPTSWTMLDRAGAISPTGTMRPFADGADGIVIGDGCGAVVLERLEDAVARGARVLALLRGSAVNNDGRTVNPMAPSPAGQVAVMRAAWSRAGLDPRTAGYVEAHGTGTRVGDAVETRTIAEAFGPRDGGAPLLLGSVKGNLGHLLNAAGMPSVIKVLEALGHRRLPPSLHGGEVSRRLGLERAGLAVVAEPTGWEGDPLRAGINGFGFGGTNAHLILEEAPRDDRPAPSARRPVLLALSAKTDGALRDLVRRLAGWLRAHPDADVAAVAREASLARDAMPHRMALVGDERLIERLERFAERGEAPAVRTGMVPRSPRRVPGRRDNGTDDPRELARRFVAGEPVDLIAYHGEGEAGRFDLPTYPFEHRPHWVESPDLGPTATRVDHPLLTRQEELRIDRAVLGARVAADDPLVAEHSVHGVHLLPGAGCIELMRAAAEHAAGAAPAGLADVTFLQPVTAGEDLRVVVERRDGRLLAEIRDGDGCALARARVLERRAQPVRASTDETLDRPFAPEALYEGLASRGMAHGPSFQAVRAIDVGDREARADLVLPKAARDRRFGLHPAMLDAAMQPVAAILLSRAADRDGLWVPLHVEAVELWGSLEDEHVSHVRLHDDPARPGDGIRCDVVVTDRDGAPRVRLRGLHLLRVSADAVGIGARDAVPALQTVDWQPLPSPQGRLEGQRWLVMPASHAAGAAVAERLRALGARVERLDEAQLERALSSGESARGLVFLGAAHPPAATLDELDRATDRGVRRLASIGRVLDGSDAGLRPARVVILTTGATDGGAPEQATAAGLGLALADEIRDLSAAVVDVAAGASITTAAEAVCRAALLDDGGLIRLREGELWRRTVVALTPSSGGRAAPLRDRGVYLVTGGATGIGLAVARHLAKAGRTLVLVGTRAIEDDPERGRRLEELRTRGATVEYVVCDVTDGDAVRGLLARIALDHGALHGVVHAAGVAAPGRLRSRTDDELTRVLGPKVRGTWILWEEIRRRGLTPDFVALFSSASASIAGLGGGLGDYVAANSFLDAFAEARRAEGHPVTSIAWSAWSETGMGADPMLLRALEQRGLAGIPTRAGVRAFEAALATASARVLVAPPSRPGGARAQPPVAPSADRRRPAPRAAASSPSVLAVADELRALVAGALEVTPERVPSDTSFLAMGLDSLVALELVKVLEERGGRELPTTLFFEHPTIDELAAHLASTGWGTGAGRGPADDGRASARAAGAVPLSKTQRAFWIQQRLHPDRPAFSFLRQTVREPLSLDALREAARAVAARHPMLRARLVLEEGQPVLRRDTACEPRIVDHGVTGDVEALADQVVSAAGDPERPPAWRVDLARDAGGHHHHLLLCTHHLIGDAWSLHLIAVDLWRAYARIRRGDSPGLEPAPADAEPVVEPAALERDLGWWKAELRRATPLALPYDGDEPPETAELTTATSRLAPGDSRAFLDAARAAGVSAFHLSLAAYARLLGRWATADRVTINVARARRDLGRSGAAEAVGCFADTLPLSLDLRPDEGATRLAERVRDRMAEIERHGTPTSVDLAPLLPRDAGGLRVASPASYSFARFPVRTPEDAPEVIATGGRTASPATRLGLAAWEHRGALCFALSFPTDRFRRDTARRMAAELREAHRRAARGEDDGARPVGASSPQLASIADRIVARLRAAPDRVALTDGSRAVTAAEVDRTSAAVAAHLRGRGIGRGDVVAVTAEQGVHAVAAILGILRAGAGWLPMDPEHPAARLREQMERADARALLVAPGVPAVGGTVPTFEIEALAASGGRPPAAPPAGDDDVAYVIFTSGSTGRPKGVPIPRRAMRGYLDWAIGAFGYGPGDVLLGTSSPCFDASVRQLLAPLLSDARLVTAPRRVARDPEALVEVMGRERVTVFSTVPSLLARVVDVLDRRPGADLSALRFVHCGGEALPPGLVRGLHDRLPQPPPVANLYGPTETTINATCHVVRERPDDGVERIPIGRPVGGATLRIVDGELWVGGRGLSPGYLGDPEQTRRRFVLSEDGERMYRTGDRVGVRPDGEIEFLGRIDDQVKVHGHRIEPGEIESLLCTHPHVALAAVRAVGEDGARRLEAWIQPRGEAPGEASLRETLRERLPEYMHPRRFHLVEALPITPTGKVDRAALPKAEPNDAEPIAPHDPPATETERLVARAFADVLGAALPGRDDDFFVLGGDSMGVLEVFARLEPSLEALPRAATLYRARTVRALARAIDEAQATGPRGSAPHPAPSTPDDDGWFPLSATQRGFVAARALDRGAPVQWSALLHLNGDLDFAVLRRAVAHLVERHPMLRAVVDLEARPPCQRVLDDAEPPVELVSPCDPTDVERLWRTAAHARFDTAAAPPWRMWLCRLASTRHALIITADHVIGDALSGWILARELLETYDDLASGEPPALRALPCRFRDLVASGGQRAVEPADAEHWRKIFARPYEPPTDWHAPAIAGDGPSVQTLELAPARVESLRGVAADRGLTLHDLLLGTWAHVLSETTGRRDLVLGVALSGREGVGGAQHLFGPFATALPVRVTADDDPAATVDAAARTFDEARAHALTPGEILRAVGPGLDPSVAGGMQLFFTFMDFEALGRLRSRELRVDWSASRTGGDLPGRVDLQLAARRLDGALRLTFQAAPRALGREQLAALRDRFADVLESLGRPATAVGVRVAPLVPSELDAALIGYLPSPAQMARAVGLHYDDALREVWRDRIFPRGEPRWVERLETGLGSSGLLCLPLFADELVAERADAIADRVAEAIGTVGAAGVRCTALAGMLPAHTGYGHAALSRLNGGPRSELTTGHATTVVAVVATVLAATQRARVDLADTEVAVVGVGSIGGAAAELLLDVGPHPAALVLCDVPRARGRLEALARHLRDARGFAGPIEIAGSRAGALPEAVYRARLIVGASSTPSVLDLRRLAPGTVVVDDSFPHLFDPAQAREHAGELLVTGGGLLDCGPIRRTLDLPDALSSFAEAIGAAIPSFGVASCQLEPLLRRAKPELPRVLGPVTIEVARLYWDAARALGIEAARLHVGARAVDSERPRAPRRA